MNILCTTETTVRREVGYERREVSVQFNVGGRRKWPNNAQTMTRRVSVSGLPSYLFHLHAHLLGGPVQLLLYKTICFGSEVFTPAFLITIDSIPTRFELCKS